MLNIGVLCSRRAPGLEALLAHSGRTFNVACVVTSHDFEHPLAIQHPIRAFRSRRDYDAATLHQLRAHNVDTVLLLGYCFIVTDVLLRAFPSAIYNIHDSDLAIRRADGERRYVGLHSTRDAILAGEKETRSTLHLVTEKLDGGPIVSLSRAFPVAPFVHQAAAAGHLDIVKA